MEVDNMVFETGKEAINEDPLIDGQGNRRVVVTKKTRYEAKNGEQFIVGVIRDITESKKTEEALRENEAKFRDLFDNAPIAYHELDTEGRYTRINHTEELLLGYTNDEMRGRHPSEFVLEKVSREAFSAKLAGNNPLQAVERTFIRKDGTLVPVLNEDRLIYDGAGKVTGIRSTLQDITERKRNEKQLEKTRDAALESARLKAEFLANMSHEIRTPMNGVVGMTGLLLDTDLSERQQEYAETIQSSADSLLTIIDDILDFSKIESGLLRFETIDFDLRAAVESPLALLAEKAQAKGLEVASLVYKDVPTALRGDPGRLRQILTNLIGNAVKFTDHGEVVVSVKTEKEDAEHIVLRFEIKDTGIGISEAAQKRLFQAFTQADGSTTRKYGGTGLGLAISKQLVGLMNGTIGIESTPGKGSTFWFTGRFEKQMDAIHITEQPYPFDLTGVRILIVDDNATNRKIMVHQSLSWGMIAAEAESGKQALELLHEAAADGQPFNIALLDLMMPEMDGFQLAGAIKTDPAIAEVALVLLPSFGQKGHGEAARIAGIAAYLQKPVRQSHLYECLSAIMAQAASTEPAGPPPLVTQHSLRESKIRQTKSQVLSNARILVAEDNPVNQKVALGQLNNLGFAATAVLNGREVLKALEAADFDIIFMDCQMPEMDGFEATAEIRRIEGTDRHTTIIAMTANALEGDRQKCLEAGMDDYLSKPVKADALREMLGRWVKPADSPAPDVVSSNGSAGAKNGGAIDRSVISGLREMQQPGKPDFVTEVIDLFLDDAALQLDQLREALSADDRPARRRLAHLIKGSSANIGADRMAKLLEELENTDTDATRANSTFTILESEFTQVKAALITERQETIL